MLGIKQSLEFIRLAEAVAWGSRLAEASPTTHLPSLLLLLLQLPWLEKRGEDRVEEKG